VVTNKQNDVGMLVSTLISGKTVSAFKTPLEILQKHLTILMQNRHYFIERNAHLNIPLHTTNTYSDVSCAELFELHCSFCHKLRQNRTLIIN